MKNILIIEDNKSYQNLLRKACGFESWHVFTADDGNEGIKLIGKEKIDLIILDILMPGMDGISFYYQLKNIIKSSSPMSLI
ncbi:MAG: hypothetical protein UT63_C0001G0032 [Candidatus Gottesmanbacteria bacterium GW2011_GWC2_39_8]|uniref:Response regulatory domain-containing protein n=1 Tax=Candidatus Gottesmanbacteria bacterium GW2011_GWC2_39_8 TaxID=1618450 RepID=A0A0G0SID0_9BACT|nr:MAG: hypothetical protein UT63_C0001G0032 [Candidatus Gottesmanbacteria bacterium GW2011_GWC2_39_8]